jgi:plastocyanin
MSRIRLSVAILVLAAALVVPTASAKTLLKGTVGPGFTISLKNAAGQKVTTLKHGVYAIRVADRSASHDFHVKGPGVNKVITGVGFVGTKTVTVTLKPGRYTFVCDPHATSMKGSFRVT